MALPLPSPSRIDLEAKAWSLRLQFWTQERIAEHLGVSQGTVSRMLARVERRELKRLSRKVERVKARQTLQLERIADEAFQGFERSKLPVKRVKQVAENGVVVAEELTITDATGAPGFLAEARAALADVRKVWGLDSRADDSTAPPATIPADVAARMLRAADGEAEIRPGGGDPHPPGDGGPPLEVGP